MRVAAILIVAMGLTSSGCGQSAPPMPQATFSEAAELCALKKTTYTPRRGLLIDEPLIDFSREAEPEEARQCFDRALTTVDGRTMERNPDSTGISYIWAWTTEPKRRPDHP